MVIGPVIRMTRNNLSKRQFYVVATLVWAIGAISAGAEAGDTGTITSSISASEQAGTVASPAPNAEPSQERISETSTQTLVLLRGLDKITARIQQLELVIGQESRFGSLLITPRYCRPRPPEEPPETFAFLEITDQKRGGALEKVFSGWMIASSPGWNALEHPVYDVWVVGCKTVTIKEGAAADQPGERPVTSPNNARPE